MIPKNFQALRVGTGDVDFLSSIEICVLDSANVLMMQVLLYIPQVSFISSEYLLRSKLIIIFFFSIPNQNWEHVQTVMKHLNHTPKTAHDTDFSRVREWNLEELGKYYRQTLLFGDFLTPEFNALMKAHAHNRNGQIRLHSIAEYYDELPSDFGDSSSSVKGKAQSSSLQELKKTLYACAIPVSPPSIARIVPEVL